MGMMELAENLQIIYGAQQLRGKILSRKDLGPYRLTAGYTAFALAMMGFRGL